MQIKDANLLSNLLHARLQNQVIKEIVFFTYFREINV